MGQRVVNPCTIRESLHPGWKIGRKTVADRTMACLTITGEWATCSHPSMFAWEPVELVGPTLEDVAAFAQELRNQAPDLPDGSTRCLLGPVYCTLDRLYVVECGLLIVPRELDEGPLPSVQWVFQRFFRSLAV